jgi:hypothetical protein
MRILSLVVLILVTLPSFAFIHKRTSHFLDIELSKDNSKIECSEHPKNNTSYLSFNLLHQGVYYFFYCRRPFSIKECRIQKEEYLKILEKVSYVRMVGISPVEEQVKDSTLRNYKMPFKAEKVISSVFIRLQAGDKCKAYFEDDCELSKNYWGGVTPEK